MNKNNKEYLIKLVQENPTLPLVFRCDNDDVCFDYGSTVYEKFYCYVGTVWFTDEGDGLVYFDDKDCVVDDYMDKLCDEKETKNMNDDEYEEYVNNWVENNIKHYEAIIIECSN